MPSSLEQIRRVYDAIWTKGTAFAQDLSGVEILHESLASLAELCVILTRDEYRRIWEHLLSEIHSPADRTTEKYSLVLTGHPGIGMFFLYSSIVDDLTRLSGKTLFLYYALGAALNAHIPVVFCHSCRFLWACDENGVREVVYGVGGTDFPLPPNALYLVDSNHELESPPIQLSIGYGGVCVLATSTESVQWKYWAKRSQAKFWFMPPCTLSEIRMLQQVSIFVERLQLFLTNTNLL